VPAARLPVSADRPKRRRDTSLSSSLGRDIDWTVRSIRDAIEAAQTMAGVEIRTVYAGVAGSHSRSQRSNGVAAIAGGEVTRAVGGAA
jgi:cell division protein FtsA